MTPIDEPASFESGAPEARKGRGSRAADQPVSADFLAFTIETSTGRIAKVETVDAQGARQELSDEERRALTKADSGVTLEKIVEQAFEAGIDCVLGGRAREEEPPEADEDLELRRALLRSLIDHSGARQLVQREVLGRAIIGTLVAQAAGAASH